MNCKNVEELLPLYVGHDLESKRVRLISAHLQACTLCARSAAEYENTNQLLQQFDPPHFSEATYAAVRQSVLREIERGVDTPTWLELLRRPFQPRLMWAVSTAVLLAVCALAYYFAANRTTAPQSNRQFAALPGTTEAPAAGLKSEVDVTGPPISPKASPKLQLNPPHQTVETNLRPGSGSRSRKPRSNETFARSTKAGGAPEVPERTAQYSTVEPPKSTNASVTAPKTLRFEIQTKDPNVRIIWFSQPSTSAGSPIESSKGI